ncbi:MAG TPA: hypothetical protein ENN38_00210 [Actinobacteria bacterium]|nr:hypothetical protein [Actinomycetota bacterium]
MREKISEFLKTKKGRMLAIIIGILSIAVVLLFIFFIIFSRGQTIDTTVVTKPAADSVTTEEKTPEAEGKPSENNDEMTDGFEVYQYKDPFEPLVVASNSTTTTTTGAGTTTTSEAETDSEIQVLVLEDIYIDDGVEYASIRYGGTVYKVTEGDRVDSSPFQVISIGEESVILLYGEDQLEVKLGQEIIK